MRVGLGLASSGLVLEPRPSRDGALGDASVGPQVLVWWKTVVALRVGAKYCVKVSTEIVIYRELILSAMLHALSAPSPRAGYSPSHAARAWGVGVLVCSFVARRSNRVDRGVASSGLLLERRPSRDSALGWGISLTHV